MRLLLVVLLASSLAVAFAAYLQPLHSAFLIDDTTYITENKRLVSLQSTELWRLFAVPYNKYDEFLPLREFSYWMDIKLFGMEPTAFRIHNILLYLLCLPLVYGVTAKLLQYFRLEEKSDIPSISLVVTALFAIHPSHAEAVVWIAGRKDLLSGLFCLLALWFALAARSERGISVPYAVWTLVLLLAAMLSKATAVAVAPIIAGLWMLFLREVPVAERRSFMLVWPAAALILAGSVAAIMASFASSRIPFYWGVEFFTRLFAILGWLLRLTVSPETRHFFYPVMDGRDFHVMVILGMVVSAFAMVGAVMVWRRKVLEWFLPVFFLLLCLPVLQIIPYSPPSLASDRFVFLAVWPVILLIVLLLWRLALIQRAVILLCISIPWGYQTWERPRDWLSNETMIGADLRAYPGYYAPASYMILTQIQNGSSRDASETAMNVSNPIFRNLLIELIVSDSRARSVVISDGDLNSALDSMKGVENLLKKPPEETRWNPAMYQIWEQCKDMLLMQWDYLIKYFSNNPLLGYYAGLSSLEMGRYKQAIAYIGNSLRSPEFPRQLRATAYYSQGIAVAKIGRGKEAEEWLRAALVQLPPEPRAYCALEQLYVGSGRDMEALQAAEGCRKNGGFLKL